MTLQRGTNDTARVPDYTLAELKAKAMRLAANNRIMGCYYTAAVLERLAV